MSSTPNRHGRVEVLLQGDIYGDFLVEQLVDYRLPKNRGKIRLPGGAIAEGETPEEAALRSLRQQYDIKLGSHNLWLLADVDLPCGSTVVRFIASHGCCNIGAQPSSSEHERRLVYCQTIPRVGEMVDLPVDSEHRIEKYDAFYA